MLEAQIVVTIQDLVAKNQLEEALDKMQSVPKCGTKATLLSQRLMGIRNQRRAGTITDAEARAEETSIAEAILEHVFECVYSTAREAIDRGNWPIITELEQLCEKFPGDTELSSLLDEARRKKADGRADRKVIQTIIEEVQSLWETNNFDEAIKRLRRARSKFPDNEAIEELYLERLTSRAVRASIQQQRNLPLAISLYQEVMRIDPTYDDVPRLLYKAKAELSGQTRTLQTIATEQIEVFRNVANRRWNSFSDNMRVAIVGLVSAILVAFIGLCGVLGQPAVAHWTAIRATRIAMLTSTPTSAITPTPSPVTPTPTLTSTPIPTPTLNCGGIQVEYLEFDLATGTGQRKDHDPSGAITLTHDEIGGLAALSGQAILSSAGSAGCCYWEGKTEVGNLWKPIGGVDCGFFIKIPDSVTAIYLKLALDEQISLFTIRVQ